MFNPYEQIRYYERFRPLIQEQMRKWRLDKLNPFNLCPSSLVFWLIIPPFGAFGVTVLGLNRVIVFWRQQIDPNETIYLLFKFLELELPMPFTLLIIFSLLGLTIADGINTLLQTVREEFVNDIAKVEMAIDGLSNSVIDLKVRVEGAITEEEHQSLLKRIDPFRLTPRLSVYFPINDNHTSIGFLTIDFAHSELSIKQSLEPNDCILSLIRFMDFHAPFPLQAAEIFLSVGLFLVGNIYNYGESKREEVLSEIKRTLK